MTILKWVTSVFIGLAFVLLMLVVIAQIPQVRDVLISRLVQTLNGQLKGQVEISGVDGDILSGLDLQGVMVSYQGKPLLRAAKVTARWDLLSLLSRRVDMTGLWIEGLDVTMTQNNDGEWDVGQALSLRKPSQQESAFTIAIRRFEIRNANVHMTTQEGPGLVSIRKLDGALVSTREKFEVEIADGKLTISNPSLGVKAVSGKFEIAKARGKLPQRLRWNDLRIQLQASTLLSNGAVELDAGGSALLQIRAAPLSPVDFKPLGSPLSLPFSFQLEAKGPWSHLLWSFSADSTAGVLQTFGSATLPFTAQTSPHWRRFSLAATGSITDWVPARWLAASGGKATTRITTDFKFTGIRLGEADRWLSASFDGTKSLVGGVRVRSFTGLLETNGDRVHGKISLASARSNLNASGEVRLRTRAYSGLVRVKNLRPEDWIGAEWSGRLNLSARVKGVGFDPDRMSAGGRIVITNSSIGTYGIRRITLPLRIANGIVSIHQGVIDTTVVDARIHGRLPIRRAGSGRMNLLARVEDLSLLYPAAATQGVAGRAMVHVRALGSLENMRLIATLRGSGLQYKKALIPDLDLSLEGHRLNVMKKEGSLEVLARSTVPVYGQTEFEEVIAAFSWQHSARKQDGTFYLAAVKDGVENRFRGRYEIETPGLKIMLEDFAVSTEGSQWLNQGEAVIDVQRDRWVVRNLDLRKGQEQLLIDGSIRPEGNQNLRLRLNRVQLKQFGPLLGRDRALGGQLDGSVWLTGTLASPVIESTLALADATFGGYRISLATLVLLYRDRWLSTELRVMQSLTTGLIRGDAKIPIDLGLGVGRQGIESRKISGRIVAENLSLQIVEAATDQVEQARGIVNMDIALGGTLSAPLFRGEISLVGGGFRVRPTRVTYSDLMLRAVLRNRTITLQTLQVRSEKNGRLKGDGEIVLASRSDTGHFGIRLVADNLLIVNTESAVAAIDADITLTGTSMNPILTGAISPRRVIFSPAPKSNKQLEAVTFDYPGVHIVQPAGVQATIIPRPESTEVKVSALTGAYVNVVVLIDRNVWVRNDDVNVEMSGQVSAFKDPGEEKLRFTGEIQTVRGFYRLQGKRLEIQDGRILFSGSDELNPFLDITLTYEVPDYLVTAHVTGTLRKPVLDLSSQPALEQSDILAVILFGKPFDGLGQGEQVAMRERVGQLLGGFAAEELRRQLGGELGIDTLEVGTTSDSTEESGGATIGVGKYLSKDVFVQYLQRFGSEVGSEVRLEYYFTRRWLVQTSAATSGQSGVDIFWRVVF